MPVRARAVIALVALSLVAAACGGETATSASRSEPDPTTSASAVQPSSSAPAGIPEILEFEAPLLGGGTLRGVDYAGKDVAFWFWAPW